MGCRARSPRAGGNIGTAAAAKAKPDGHTLLLNLSSAHVINPALYKTTGFDPVKDFEPITLVATAGYVLVANNNFPAKNVSELMESLIPEYSAFGVVREPAGSALPSIAPSNAYRCRDGVVLIARNGDSNALALMGYETGVDLAALIEARKRLPALIGHDTPSQIVKAGRRFDLHPVPADFEQIRARAEARHI